MLSHCESNKYFKYFYDFNKLQLHYQTENDSIFYYATYIPYCIYTPQIIDNFEEIGKYIFF